MSPMELVLKNKKRKISYIRETFLWIFLKLPVQMHLKIANNASVKLLLKTSSKFSYQLQSHLRVAIPFVL